MGGRGGPIPMIFFEAFPTGVREFSSFIGTQSARISLCWGWSSHL